MQEDEGTEEIDFDYRSYKEVLLKFSKKERVYRLRGHCSYKAKQGRAKSRMRGEGETPLGLGIPM